MERSRLLPNSPKDIIRSLTDEDLQLMEHARNSPKMRSQLTELDRIITDLRSGLYRPNGQIRPDIEDQLNAMMNVRQQVYEELTGKQFSGEKCFVENSEEKRVSIEDAQLDDSESFDTASEEKKQAIRKFIQQLIDEHAESPHRYLADVNKINAVYMLVRSKKYELLGRENLIKLFNNIKWSSIEAKFDRYETSPKRQ